MGRLRVEKHRGGEMWGGEGGDGERKEGMLGEEEQSRWGREEEEERISVAGGDGG